MRILALKEAVFTTVSRRFFITLPIIFYLKYEYGDDFNVPFVTEAIIFGFFGSVVHDYIVRFIFLKKYFRVRNERTVDCSKYINK